MFAAACNLGLEGIVSKKLDAPYRSGPSKTWIKVKIQSLPLRRGRSMGLLKQWAILLSVTIPRAAAVRRPTRIVKLIRHAKSTDAAHGCPALLNGEETAIGGAASLTRILARTIEYYRRAERWRAFASAPLAP